MSALPSSRGPVVKVNDARTTALGLAFVIAPTVALVVLTAVFLGSSPYLLPALVAEFGVLAAVLVGLFLRGPAVTRG